MVYVMAAQVLSGIAKDLGKVSAKSAIKTVVPVEAGQEQQGGAALFAVGFAGSVSAMAVGLALAWLLTLSLPSAMGKTKQKPAFAAVFSKSRGINVPLLARFFLFGARDVWFVVAPPVFLEMSMDWNFRQVGCFMDLGGLRPGVCHEFLHPLPQGAGLHGSGGGTEIKLTLLGGFSISS